MLSNIHFKNGKKMLIAWIDEEGDLKSVSNMTSLQKELLKESLENIDSDEK